MIKFADIEKALQNLIWSCFGKNTIASFEFIEKPDRDYVYINLRPARKDLGFGLFERSIRVNFTISLIPNGFAMRNFGGLYEMVDILDAATLHSLPIADRHITIYDASFTLFDSVGTYSFKLDFADYYNELPANERAEFMESLKLPFTLKSNTHTSNDDSEIIIDTLDEDTQSDYNND